MKRFALLVTCGLMLASSGCCLFGQPWCGSPYGAGYGPQQGGFGGYGGYPGNCPGGACGVYPGAYMGGAPTATVPYGYPQAVMVDPLPQY